jgi:hypothetical protein
MSDQEVDFSGFDFGADTTEVNTDFNLLPVGMYFLQVDECKWKTDKENRPELNLKLKVVGHEEHEGAVVFHTVRLFHTKCREIALKELAKLSMSCFGSKMVFKSKDDYLVFQGKVCKAKVKHETYQDSTSARIGFFDDKNDPSYVEANLASKEETFTEQAPPPQASSDDDVPF